MTSSYTVDDVLQAGSCFVKNSDTFWEQFCETQETLEEQSFAQLKLIYDNQESQKGAEEMLQKEFKKLDSIRIDLEKNRVGLQGLNDIVAKLKEQKFEKENQLSKMEEEIEKMRKNIQCTIKDREDIMKKKDIILTYKLLTNTSFVYTTKKVTGIVLKNPPKSFSFNLQESREEITQKLWSLVLEDQ